MTDRRDVSPVLGSSVRITTSGAISIMEFVVPTAGGFPNGIVAGGDGNLWFTEQSGNKIGRIVP